MNRLEVGRTRRKPIAPQRVNVHAQACRVRVRNEGTEFRVTAVSPSNDMRHPDAGALRMARHFAQPRGRAQPFEIDVRISPVVLADELRELELRPELGANALKLRGIEALQPECGVACPVAALRQHVEHDAADVLAVPAMPVGRLDFRVQPDLSAGGGIQPTDELDFLCQCPEREPQSLARVATGVERCPGERIDALVHREPAQFGEVEVNRVEVAVGTPSLREVRGDVGDGLQEDIVQHDRHIVARQYHVLFEIISAHRMRQLLRRQRVLRQVAGGAAMSDDDGHGSWSLGGPSAGGQQCEPG